MGLSALSPERRREIASAAGRASQASGNARRWTVEEARRAGKKGGCRDAERMRELGRLGAGKRKRRRCLVCQTLTHNKKYCCDACRAYAARLRRQGS